jgi:hypothetical protein
MVGHEAGEALDVSVDRRLREGMFAQRYLTGERALGVWEATETIAGLGRVLIPGSEEEKAGCDEVEWQSEALLSRRKGGHELAVTDALRHEGAGGKRTVVGDEVERNLATWDGADAVYGLSRIG